MGRARVLQKFDVVLLCGGSLNQFVSGGSDSEEVELTEWSCATRVFQPGTGPTWSAMCMDGTLRKREGTERPSMSAISATFSWIFPFLAILTTSSALRLHLANTSTVEICMLANVAAQLVLFRLKRACQEIDPFRRVVA